MMWILLFATLTLNEAISTALRQQPDLQQAQALVEIAEARAKQMRAPLLPQLIGGASYQRTTANFTPRPGVVPNNIGGTPEATFDTYNFFNASLSLQQLVYDFDRTWGAWKAAKADVDAQRETRRTSERIVVLAVQSAYFNARAAKALVKVAEETQTNQQRHLQQIEGFVDVGTRPEIDLLQVRTEVATTRVQLIRAQNGYRTARAQLNQAMGVEGPSDFDLADESFPPLDGEDLSTEELISEAIEHRSELAALFAQSAGQDRRISAVKGGYGPSLSVSTQLTEAGTDFDNEAWNWNAGAALNWPIFEGGLTMARVDEARAQLKNITAQVDKLRQQIRLEVERAYVDVHAAKEQLQAASEAEANARERLRLAEGRYETGVGSIIELGDAQTALTDASAQVVQATYLLASARAQLQSALGRQ